MGMQGSDDRPSRAGDGGECTSHESRGPRRASGIGLQIFQCPPRQLGILHRVFGGWLGARRQFRRVSDGQHEVAVGVGVGLAIQIEQRNPGQVDAGLFSDLALDRGLEDPLRPIVSFDVAADQPDRARGVTCVIGPYVEQPAPVTVQHRTDIDREAGAFDHQRLKRRTMPLISDPTTSAPSTGGPKRRTWGSTTVASAPRCGPVVVLKGADWGGADARLSSRVAVASSVLRGDASAASMSAGSAVTSAASMSAGSAVTSAASMSARSVVTSAAGTRSGPTASWGSTVSDVAPALASVSGTAC